MFARRKSKTTILRAVQSTTSKNDRTPIVSRSRSSNLEPYPYRGVNWFTTHEEVELQHNSSYDRHRCVARDSVQLLWLWPSLKCFHRMLLVREVPACCSLFIDDSNKRALRNGIDSGSRITHYGPDLSTETASGEVLNAFYIIRSISPDIRWQLSQAIDSLRTLANWLILQTTPPH